MPIINVATAFSVLLPGARAPGPRIEVGMQEVSQEVADHPYTQMNIVGGAVDAIPAPGSPEARAAIEAAAQAARREAGERIVQHDAAKRVPRAAKSSAHLRTDPAKELASPTRFHTAGKRSD